MSKALIAMSGGVDSTVAAVCMTEAGYDCVGVTMRLHDYSESCGAAKEADDAAAVAEKRAASEYALSLEELGECVPGREKPEEDLDADLLADAIGAYLRTVKARARETFVLRYFYALSLQEIADRQGSTLSAVKTILHRTRTGLREYLEKEGYSV